MSVFIKGSFRRLFSREFAARRWLSNAFGLDDARIFRASVRGAGVARIVEIRANDHASATRKIERRYDGAMVEWIHQKAA